MAKVLMHTAVALTLLSPTCCCRAQRERVLASSAQGEEEQPAKQSYKGMNAYTDYKAGFRREGHTVGAEKGSGSHGPLRGNVFVRSTARYASLAVSGFMHSLITVLTDLQTMQS
jgi:hypothetical protein